MLTMSFILHYRDVNIVHYPLGLAVTEPSQGHISKAKLQHGRSPFPLHLPWSNGAHSYLGCSLEAYSTCNVHITGAASRLPKAAAKQELFACECSPDPKCQLFLQRTSGLGLNKEAVVPVLNSKADSNSGVQGEVVSVEPTFNGIFMCCLGF